MILVNSYGIHRSGALLLLEYFLKKLSKRSKIILIQDSRSQINLSSYAESIFISKNYLNSQLIIYENQHKAKSIFCFNNFAPLIKPKIDVFVYFHNPYLSKRSFKNLNINFRKKLTYFLKKIVFKLTYKNSSNYIFQSKALLRQFEKKYTTHKLKLFVLPFYDESLYDEYKKNAKNKNHFVYVSYPHTHKNHFRLITAWKRFAKNSKNSVLNLTLDSTGFGVEIIKEIKKINKYLGYKSIVNHGIVNHRKSLHLTSISEYTIFPSMAETFGMGLLEGCILNNKILCSDLDVFKEILSEAIFFNPHSEIEIYDSLMLTRNDLKKPKLLIKNNIKILLDKIVK